MTETKEDGQSPICQTKDVTQSEQSRMTKTKEDGQSPICQTKDV
jgi:hypothetical protein